MNPARFIQLSAAFACIVATAFAETHPLDAVAVVPAFDRIVAEGSDASLARGGLLLLGELNCTACHAAPAPWREQLAPSAGPNLAGVGSRLGADALRQMIGNPQQCEGGTRMPRLFAGD